MPDVKKLIAGFLILAAGASSSVLIFSDLNAPSASRELAANTGSSPALGNAFAAQPSDNTLTPEITNSPDNLTGNLTGVILNGIMAANPQGPITAANGDQIMTPPDQKTMLAELSSDPSFKNFKAPDWDAEAAAQKLNIVSNATSATIAYLTDFNNIFQKDIAQADIQSIVNQNQNTNADPNSLAVVNNAITDAFNEAVQIPTPVNLVDFQKSFIKFLTYQKNSLQTVQNYNDDPIKASLTLQAESSRYQAAVSQFENAGQKIKNLALESDLNKGISSGDPDAGKQDSTLAFFNAVLGISTAYAIPVEVTSDWIEALNLIKTTLTASATWEQIGLTLEKYAEQLALQLVKNALVFVIQNKVLAWVNGSGAPRFITQWANALINVATAKALNTLDSMTPLVCPSFGPLINASLNASLSLNTSLEGFQTCPAPMMGTALQDFNDNFANGGWNSYYSMLQPEGNFYSQYMDISDQMDAAASAQESAATAQATANQGFTGDATCADGSNPNGSHQICVDAIGATIPTVDLSNSANLTLSSPSALSLGGGNATLPSLPTQGCSAGQVPETIPNGGLCADGTEPTVTTPGQATGQILSKALGANISLIVNAQNITGIITSAAESLMSNIMQTAETSVMNNISGYGENNGGMTGIYDNTLSQTPGWNVSIPLSCSPAITTTQIQTTQNSNGNSNVSAQFSVAATGDTDQYGNAPTYIWSAPGANPSAGYGDTFGGSYNTTGIHTITVTAPLMTDTTQTVTTTCQVVVTTNAPVSCSPTMQTVYLPITRATSSVSATVTASNGSTEYNGSIIAPTYTWTIAPDAVSSLISGNESSTFTGTFDAPGTYTASVTASTDNTSASCQIKVEQQSNTTQP